MENALPFEYGYMYKIVQNPTPEDKNAIEQLYWQQDNLASFYDYNYDSYNNPGGSFDSQVLDPSGNFLPIGFLEKDQKVVLEVIVSETERVKNLLVLNNNQFSKMEVSKRNKRLRRLEMDVNLFIRNFEKIL